MRCAEATHWKMIVLLKQLGIKSAETITEAEAVREYGRLERRFWSRGKYMTPDKLYERGLQRHRSRNTHRGKR